MAPGIKLVSEVVHHVADLIPVAALGQAQHGEIAVPVIDFAEASSRHDIGLWQGQEGVPFVRFVSGAGQYRPQIVYVFAQALALRGTYFSPSFGRIKFISTKWRRSKPDWVCCIR